MHSEKEGCRQCLMIYYINCDSASSDLTWTVLVRQFLHVSLSGVLAKCPQHLPNLGHLDLAITLLVKDAEGLLELCEGKSLLLEVIKVSDKQESNAQDATIKVK